MGNNHQCESRCGWDDCHWKLFQNDNFEGHYNDMCYRYIAETLPGGGPAIYTGQSHWTNWQFQNDDVSSFALSSHPSWICQYTLCQHYDGTGNCMIVTASQGVCCSYTMDQLIDNGIGNVCIIVTLYITIT